MSSGMQPQMQPLTGIPSELNVNLSPDASRGTTESRYEEPRPCPITSAAILSQQREWRKTIGKDLPKFGGEPEEWPEYLNRFRLSTEKCGFDDQENMSRLRKTLVGKAKTSVLDLLLVTEDPRKVIVALQRKFERLDHVIRLLLSKIRKHEPQGWRLHYLV